jgi:hypothetical protein
MEENEAIIPLHKKIAVILHDDILTEYADRSQKCAGLFRRYS